VTQSFTDLEVWKTGHSLVLKIYKITKNFPRDEQYGLISQMKRSSASITANIAEGFGRKNSKEKEQFYLIAAGSLFELKDQLLIARDVDYLNESDFTVIAEIANKCHAQLNAMLRTHRNNRNSKFENRDSK
jgi:four helix bundle protein